MIAYCSQKQSHGRTTPKRSILGHYASPGAMVRRYIYAQERCMDACCYAWICLREPNMSKNVLQLLHRQTVQVLNQVLLSLG